MAEKVVQAQRFELMDHTGAVRGVLACDAQSGSPTLTMKDGRGQTRLTVGIAWNDMPSIQLNADDGTARVALVARPEGTGLVLVVNDRGDKNVLTIDAE